MRRARYLIQLYGVRGVLYWYRERRTIAILRRHVRTQTPNENPKY